MKEMRLFNRWTVDRRLFWAVVGVLLLGGLMVICVLSLLGPRASQQSLLGLSDVYPAVVTVEVEKSIEMPRGTMAPPLAAATAVSESYSPQQPLDNVSQAPVRMIVREGVVSLAVNDTIATRKSIEQIVADMTSEGAFVVSSTQYGEVEGGSPQIFMSIRIPAVRFDATMNGLAEMAERVDERTETAQDVTAEYVDVQARLKSLTTARDRLLGIMERSATTKDLLEAEQQLTQREAEIEALQGRLNYLEEVASLSKIDITLSPYRPSQPLDTRWRPSETVRRAVDSLVRSLQDFADFLIVFTISALPWLVVIGLIIYLAIRFLVRRLSKKPAPPHE